jgi:uncharacterized lipoprotein YbaY
MARLHPLRESAVLVLLCICVGAVGAVSTQESSQRPSAENFVGKAWVSIDAGSAAGTLRMFLPDGTLMMDSCVETYRLARWRLVAPRKVEWYEDTARIQADVTEVGRDQLKLRLQLAGDIKEENYRLARVPFTCPDLRSTPSSGLVHVEGRLYFLERLALPSSAVVRVELRDTLRAGAPPRTRARQTFTAKQGPPFAFSLAVPANSIDPGATMSLFAEIRDGRRQMFIAESANTVPAQGAKGLELHLKFVASAQGDAAPGIVTPSPGTYRCGEETFKVAFEELRAYVTMPDGSVVTFQRQFSGGAKGDGRRTFSNGRLTFVQEVEGADGPRLLFARGRMLPTPCTRQ